jgi:hypothetical protein
MVGCECETGVAVGNMAHELDAGAGDAAERLAVRSNGVTLTYGMPDQEIACGGGLDELRGFVRVGIAAYKYLRLVWLTDDLPKRAYRESPQS